MRIRIKKRIEREREKERVCLDQESISPTFCTTLFCTKVSRAVFLLTF
jgi:hypothetical protein